MSIDAKNLILSEAQPSEWLKRHASHIQPNGLVLDVACGAGRNSCWLAGQGFMVEAVDINQASLDAMLGLKNISLKQADLENADWPYEPLLFDAIVVCRYLHRPLFPMIKDSLKTNGILIYETFMLGQAEYGRPTNPNFLLNSEELKQSFSDGFELIAFEEGLFNEPQAAMLQRICVKKL